MSQEIENSKKLRFGEHAQGELFVADIFDSLAFKDDMASMEYPIFSLSKKKDLRVLEYANNNIRVTISPSLEYGLPTIFDKDILLYCGSLLMSEVNKGNVPPKELLISSHDLMIATKRTTDKDSYDRLEKALQRLTGVLITTNIPTNKIVQGKGFHLIDSYEFIKSNFVKNRRVALKITLSDWFYNSIIGKEVLTINKDYFYLGKSLERRLYEIARKHCGKQFKWSIGLEVLKEKTGSISPISKFRYFINEIIKVNNLPDYIISFSDDPNNSDLVCFQRRKEFRAAGDIPELKPETIERGRVITQKAGTGWDFYALHTQYCEQLFQGFRPHSVDGAFIAFIKKKVVQCP